MAKLAAKSLDLNEIIWAPENKGTPRYDALHGLFEKAIEERSARNRDNIIGATIYLPYADGHATYIVVKARPLTLIHVYLGDGWQVPFYSINGLRKADIESMRISEPGRGRWGGYYGENKATDADREFVVQKLQALLPEVFDGTALEPLKAKA
jgi:hypothetical protein